MAGHFLTVRPMQSFTFTTLLKEAVSVEDLARRLGVVCMKREAELKEDLDDDLCRKVADTMEGHVVASDPDSWTKVVEDPGTFETQLGADFFAEMGKADLNYPLDCLGILRGLCRRVLPRLYLRNEGQVELDRGVPVPFAIRPLLAGVEKTPHPERLNGGELLGGYGHRLFEFWRESESVRVTLDFSVRQQIDELTWSRKGRLPKIATVHPKDCGSLRIPPIIDERFFGVKPSHWRPDEVADLLRRVSDVEIAVLPELSLPQPDALETILSRSPDDFPPLVVAGSAHTTDRSSSRLVRANESRIYLEGHLVAVHRKCHAYEATRLGGKKLPRPAKEGITSEPKSIIVLSGELSRLVVVICADLNDTGSIPQKLLAAGVNTLIVPSFTHKKGSFRGPTGDLAARCQAIAVIANAPPADATSPFYGMVALPLPGPEEALGTYPVPPDEAEGQIAVVDPNEPFPEAISWR
jgi:hypothetical protein